MPVAATGLADVSARDAQPLVLGGSVEHALEQLAVAGLELGVPAQLQPRLADTGRQRVANGLQGAEVERPRLARQGGDPGLDPQGKGLGRERSELRLEPPDLAPQLRPGEPLVAIHAQRGKHLSFEQIRHRPETSVDHAYDPKAVALLSDPVRRVTRRGWRRRSTAPRRRLSGGRR
jgi:hypothetical protein